MKTGRTFTIEVTRDPDGIWIARCDRLCLFADAESYDVLFGEAEEIACDMAVALGMVKSGQTMSLQFVQKQHIAPVS